VLLVLFKTLNETLFLKTLLHLLVLQLTLFKIMFKLLNVSLELLYLGICLWMIDLNFNTIILVSDLQLKVFVYSLITTLVF
jgi:hypothetical protein